MDNPFQYGAELKPEQIVDRKLEIRDTARAVTEQGRLFLIGPRRFGKSAILRAAATQARGAGAIVLLLDAEAYPDTAGLVGALVTESAKALKSDVSRTGERILRFFSRLRPMITYNPLEGSWTGGVNVDGNPDSDQTPMLIEALDGIGRLAADTGKPVAIMIDEFHKALRWGAESAEGQIRAAVQRHPEVGFVFSGSKTTLLNDMTLNPARPFYRMGIRHFLGPLPREEFRPFIAQGFERGGHHANPNAVEYILDCAEDVPYNVQALASTLWERLRDEPRCEVTQDLVREALKLLVARDSPFYVTLWNGLTNVQQRVLSAVVAEKSMGLTSGAVTRRHAVSASTMSKTLRLLEEREILRREEQPGSVRWRLEDPFFAAWLAP
ncbi:MAG: hypothetical protein ACREU3_15885 [Steroidobacteraceae bacterium]